MWGLQNNGAATVNVVRVSRIQLQRRRTWQTDDAATNSKVKLGPHKKKEKYSVQAKLTARGILL